MATNWTYEIEKANRAYEQAESDGDYLAQESITKEIVQMQEFETQQINKERKERYEKYEGECRGKGLEPTYEGFKLWLLLNGV
jgi:hypothetical protein